jgi:hypothetical protein
MPVDSRIERRQHETVVGFVVGDIIKPRDGRALAEMVDISLYLAINDKMTSFSWFRV